MTTEKRLAVRYTVEVSAEVYTREHVLGARTRNLSNTGVCLDMNKALKERSTIGLSLFLVVDGIEDPDAEPLNIKADVIWSSERDDGGYSSGLRFDTSDSAATAAIEEFLSQLE
ncbi:MAG: PilZ domain-containing protein [Deltaproteobacteria bacterium]|nr:PilZ domain-containing protein [Deltaproteobacteria bacterium]